MNSIYLMASTLIVSASGFVFWMIATHFYKDYQVGLVTALISVVMFIMNISILGLNYSLIRFLPKSKYKNQLISTSVLAIGLASAVCAAVFLLFLPFFSPKLEFIRQNFSTTALFFILTLFISLDFATESIYLALRSGKYIFIKNLLVSALKLLLPVFFVPFGAVGIFIAWATALSSALLVSTVVLVKRFDFKFTPSFTKINLARLISFSSVNFAVGLLGIAPAFILPILITNTINPETTAHFYIAFMIANLLYTIPYATTQSLFAEGAHNELNFLQSIKKSLRMIGILLIPSIVFLILLGNFILLLFGATYSQEGIVFLRLLALAGIPVSLNYLGLTILNVKHRMKALLVINTVGIFLILFLSFVLRGYSLMGVGIAWLVGHLIKNFLYVGYIVLFMPDKRLRPITVLTYMRNLQLRRGEQG